MFGKRLKFLREAYGLTQEQLARQFSFSKSSISMYENNVRFPSVEVLIEFSKFFKVSIDYLLDNNCISDLREQELDANILFQEFLRRIGYIKDNEDLTDKELERLIEFIKQNKEFIRNYK